MAKALRYTYRDTRGKVVSFYDDGSHEEFTFIDARGRSILVDASDGTGGGASVPEPTPADTGHPLTPQADGSLAYQPIPAQVDEVPDTTPGDDNAGYVLTQGKSQSNKPVWTGITAFLSNVVQRIAALEAWQRVPTPAAGDVGKYLTATAAGVLGFATPATGGGGDTYMSSVLVKTSQNPFNFAAIVPNDPNGKPCTHVVICAGGGGGGGFARDANDQNSRAPGGNPGEAVQKPKRLVSSVPASFSVTIGAGGLGQGNTGGACLAGAGGDTIVPALDIAALGGPGGYLFSGNTPPQPVPGNIPSGRAGQGLPNVNGQAQFGVHNASHGPGPGAGGGALANQTDGYNYGGNGGDSNVDTPSLRLTGGDGRANNGALARNGKDATDPRAWGSGGGGANFFNGSPGNGGFPSGAGGGGGAGSNGGNGVLAFHFYY